MQAGELRAPARIGSRMRSTAGRGQDHPRHGRRPRPRTASSPGAAGRRGLPADHGRIRPRITAATRPRPVPGTGSPDPAQAHRRHPRETQTPGQPRIPRRNRTRIVHPAPAPGADHPCRPATLIKAKPQKGRRFAHLPLNALRSVLPECAGLLPGTAGPGCAPELLVLPAGRPGCPGPLAPRVRRRRGR